MERVDWKVEGMHCTNCALNVTKYLEKEGMHQVKVNPISGDVSFVNAPGTETKKLGKGITNLGYSVVEEALEHETDNHDSHAGHHHGKPSGGFLNNNKKRFFFCLPFALILMLHMVENWLPHDIAHWLMNPWLQLALCLPVFIVGMLYFGKSAIQSIKNGVPNMDVLITVGALASFIYSLVGAIQNLGHGYLFFETTSSIITLVFLGNYLEETTIRSTQREVEKLAKAQKVMANMIAFDDQHKEQVFQVESKVLKNGDLILIKTGEQVPADCKIIWGECEVSEAIITGESAPLHKEKKDNLIGGSIIENGVVKAQVTAAGNDTVLSGILKMVRDAQAEKPPMQKLADRISAVFVPLVIGIAVLTFIGNYFYLHNAGTALMRAIAVLVISCPCAMGLATPAAIAVGLSRGSKNGILFRNAAALEHFKDIKKVVFDKTGTLTTGKFSIAEFSSNIPEDEFKKIAYSLEKYSIHPLAQPIVKNWNTGGLINWQKVEEVKGMGVKAIDKDGNTFFAGSDKILKSPAGDHNIFITKNGELLGWIDLRDEIREEAKEVIAYLHSKNIRTVLLTGDKQTKANQVASMLGIDEVIAEKTPAEKLETIATLASQQPTAMVGDGVNDAPALAKASLGISLSDASHVAMQSADVILVNHGLKHLPTALGLGRHTDITIKQNLFWAFLYNIIAIPIAAFGYLTPTFSALAMGLSDVVLAINSVRLFVKKVS